MGNGGNAQSKFEDRGSGDGRLAFTGAVALLVGGGGLPKGDLVPSFGVLGEPLLDGDALTGVSSSWGKNGRSVVELAQCTAHETNTSTTYWQLRCQLSEALLFQV